VARVERLCIKQVKNVSRKNKRYAVSLLLSFSVSFAKSFNYVLEHRPWW